MCHLDITTDGLSLHETLEGLVSPAPTLEYLSLHSSQADHEEQPSVPDTIFDGAAPRLSCLELRDCNISWKSPLLKGLRYLEISKLSTLERPSLSVWLDALDELPQLKTLTLCEASPIAPTGARLPSYVERTITHRSLTYLDIVGSARDCGLALAHLVLPALIHLGVKAGSFSRSGGESASDVQDILPYFSQHAHGPQDTQPLQSVFVCSTEKCIKIFAWTFPDIDIELPDQIPLFKPMHSARVAFYVVNVAWRPGTHTAIFDAAMATLPLDSIVTLTTDGFSQFDEQFWLRYAPRWPLLRRVRLASPAARGFTEMLLDEHGERECPLLPLLSKLVLNKAGLRARRILLLCNAFMKRMEQGVPLETLELHKCLATSRAVDLLSEIVVEVLGPEETLKRKAQEVSECVSVLRGPFVPDTGSNDGSWDDWELELDKDKKWYDQPSYSYW